MGYSECNAEASKRGQHFFVMESPAGNTGRAKCGFGGDYSGFNYATGKDYTGVNDIEHLRLPDADCSAQKDSDGRPMGGLFKMAIYELSSYMEVRCQPPAASPPLRGWSVGARLHC